MAQKLLEARHLSISFGARPVIRDLNFIVQLGDFFVILGPNGAGKTTLLKALLGLVPYKGQVIWRKQLNLSYLPQHLSPAFFQAYPLSVREFFQFKNAQEKQTKHALEAVGLKPEEILAKSPSQLSSGQLQRLMVAWSLVDNPQLLLLDEPTLSIDAKGEETLYSLLYHLWRERGLTIILVSHELDVVVNLATKVLCLRGEQICYGPPLEVLTPQMLRQLYGMRLKFHKHHHKFFNHNKPAQ